MLEPDHQPSHVHESRLAELPGQLKAFRIQDVAWLQVWMILPSIPELQPFKKGGAADSDMRQF